jgi:hypothetical protein
MNEKINRDDNIISASLSAQNSEFQFHSSFREKLAECCYAKWIPLDEAPFEGLPEDEKEGFRDEADNILEVFSSLSAEEFKEWYILLNSMERRFPIGFPPMGVDIFPVVSSSLLDYAQKVEDILNSKVKEYEGYINQVFPERSSEHNRHLAKINLLMELKGLLKLHTCEICGAVVDRPGVACNMEHAEEWRKRNGINKEAVK